MRREPGDYGRSFAPDEELKSIHIGGYSVLIKRSLQDASIEPFPNRQANSQFALIPPLELRFEPLSQDFNHSTVQYPFL